MAEPVQLTLDAWLAEPGPSEVPPAPAPLEVRPADTAPPPGPFRLAYDGTRATVWEGDCLEVLAALPADSVDAVVTDPPYGLEFMGKEWDRLWVKHPDGQAGRIGGRGGMETFGRIPIYQAGAAAQEWHRRWAVAVLRVLKPGGHALVFGGTRTFHRLACALEDAGFEIRDCLMWLYGSGFPKSHDLSKAVDKALGAEREKVRIPVAQVNNPKVIQSGHGIEGGDRPFMQAARETGYHELDGDVPVTEAARRWYGWGTGLKPAWEPILLARRPLIGTAAENLLAHGVGGLNIAGTRIGHAGGSRTDGVPNFRNQVFGRGMGGARTIASDVGRWPANLVLTHTADCELRGTRRVKGNLAPPSPDGRTFTSGYQGGLGLSRPARGIGDEDGMQTIEDWRCAPGCAIAALNEQSGETESPESRPRSPDGEAKATWSLGRQGGIQVGHGDRGGASRFFFTGKADDEEGRWPANLVLDEAAAARLDAQSGETTSKPYPVQVRTEPSKTNSLGLDGSLHRAYLGGGYADSGGASRFFYTAKADAEDRDGSKHPTVKPVSLMTWLIRLITPPGGTVLDPFAGSGTTVYAAREAGFTGIGIEREPAYVQDILRRLRQDVLPL